jgi:hypothetical protein
MVIFSGGEISAKETFLDDRRKTARVFAPWLITNISLRVKENPKGNVLQTLQSAEGKNIQGIDKIQPNLQKLCRQGPICRN